MSVFKSHQVNFDPEPYTLRNGARGERFATFDEASEHPAWMTMENSIDFYLRPEFEPTRDPRPWKCSSGRSHERCDAAHWAPRREQFDTPVNPILVQLRGELQFVGTGTSERARSFLSDLDRDWRADFTPEQIDHARRVLTRLAALA